MNLDSLREYCLSFPRATENVQWGNDLCFKVGGKLFTVASLYPEATGVSFKCTPDEFAELVERETIKPADYVARYHWVTVQAWDALPDRELRRLIAKSYELVAAKLPRKWAVGSGQQAVSAPRKQRAPLRGATPKTVGRSSRRKSAGRRPR
jgi:predicted DNA-binding protein (MmcQ/YjbR family)